MRASLRLVTLLINVIFVIADLYFMRDHTERVLYKHFFEECKTYSFAVMQNAQT